MRIGIKKALVGIIALFMGPGGALAQEATDGHLAIELNAMDSMQSACRLSFLVNNSYAEDITKAVFEAVLFDGEGRVDRLSLFDFGSLPAGRPRVRQFVVPDLACDALGQVLINGTESCESAGLSDMACLEGLQVTSRTDVEVIG